MIDVLCFGEILFDRIEGQNYIGGAPLNVAAHLSKLGARSSMISALGHDLLGERARTSLHELSINDDLVITNQYPTGTVDVTLVNGQPEYEIADNVAYDNIKLDKVQKPDFDVLYFGSLAQRHKISQNTLRRLISCGSFKEIFYDVNLRKGGYNDEIIKGSIDRCSILKLNEQEVNHLSNILFSKVLIPEIFATKVLHDFKLNLVIITAGSKGCYLCYNDQYVIVRSKPVDIEDTVGAGDAFSAAFIYEFMKSGKVEDAAKRANILGGYVASKRGAIPEYDRNLLYSNYT